jgi:hypothetical protein
VRWKEAGGVNPWSVKSVKSVIFHCTPSRTLSPPYFYLFFAYVPFAIDPGVSEIRAMTFH